MADSNNKLESAAGDVKRKAVAEVTGLLDGIGESIYEFVKKSNFAQLLGAWVVLVGTIDVATRRLVSFFENDPDGSLARLRHEQRQAMIEMAKTHTKEMFEYFLGKARELSSEAFEKGSDLYDYLKNLEIADQAEIDRIANEAKQNAEIHRQRSARLKIQTRWIAWIGFTVVVIIISITTFDWQHEGPIVIGLGVMISVAIISAVVYLLSKRLVHVERGRITIGRRC